MKQTGQVIAGLLLSGLFFYGRNVWKKAVRKSCEEKLCGKTVWKNCVEKLCGKTVWKNCVEKLCRKAVQKSCVEKAA